MVARQVQALPEIAENDSARDGRMPISNVCSYVFRRDPAVQQLLADAVTSVATSRAARDLALRVMASVEAARAAAGVDRCNRAMHCSRLTSRHFRS